MDLTDGYTFEDDNNEAILIMEVLCLAMQLRFEKRDVRKKQLLTPGNLSSSVVDYIVDTDVPRVPQAGAGTALRAAGESQQSIFVRHPGINFWEWC